MGCIERHALWRITRVLRYRDAHFELFYCENQVETILFIEGVTKVKSKVNKIGIILITIIAIIILILWYTGLIGLWTSGMASIAKNTKGFTDTNGHAIQGEYSVSIDLDDLQSNIGKELYNDGNNKIYVSWIDNTGNSNSGGYRIGFRSCGQYSLINATLVSGVHHKTVSENSFTSVMSAKMTAKYNDKVYNCEIYSTSGLNYNDGDDFSFYIFPQESYENNEISLSEEGLVYLSVTDLYKNVWSKKQG